MPRLMIDLFAGLGGASEAFEKHPDWEVIRVELCEDIIHHAITELDEFTHVNESTYIWGNLCQWSTIEALLSKVGGRGVDFIWASPPCTEFSLARVPQIQDPDMTLLLVARSLIRMFQPRYWAIENVKGAIKKFSPIIGHKPAMMDPYYLWGNVPRFAAPKHKKIDNDVWSTDVLRPWRLALVPRSFSEAMRQTIDWQRGLDDYLNR